MKKIQKKGKGIVFLLLVLTFCISYKPAEAAGQADNKQRLFQVVGRYRLNYTGNTSHYTYWGEDGWPVSPGPGAGNREYVYNDLGQGDANSSGGELARSTEKSTIKYAYLTWQTRTPENEMKAVDLVTPTGKRKSITPTYKYSDWREAAGSWGYHTMFNMAADVTDIVQEAGYGEYYVCNIQKWKPTIKDSQGKYPGGESPGSWQLIIVEEDADFPVRVVSLEMGSDFKMGEDYDSELELHRNGLKTKVNGRVKGQIFFGVSNSSPSALMTENFIACDGNGNEIKKIGSTKTMTAGLYKVGSLWNNRDERDGCIRMSLSDIDDIGNGVGQIKLVVENENWSSFFFLGMSADIAFPDFTANQKTIVNSADSVTVSGNIANVSSNPNTGICTGNLVVNLDSGLVAKSGTAVINGTTAIAGSISGNTVTFKGNAMASIMKGDTITYTVECVTGNSGKTVFENSDDFCGVLYSEGINTGYWVNKACASSSREIPKYSVIVQPGTGIQSVSGSGEYTYGAAVTAAAVPKPGYHWRAWSGSYTAVQQNFVFPMPARNVTLAANGEANTYKIILNANDGSEVNHPADIVAKYDEETVLPDGAGFYERYTLDGAEADRDSGNLSVFMGWSLEDGKESFVPQWKAGNLVKNLTEENNDVVTLYAIWDDWPWIQGEDLYYTLEQAKSGFITEEEILSHFIASDREDGSHIEPGVREDEASFWIPDYRENTYTQLVREGSCIEELEVIDHTGNSYQKEITVRIIDTTAAAVRKDSGMRFINEKYYSKPYAQGGLEDSSVWKRDAEYASVLQSALTAQRDHVPEKTYVFNHGKILRAKEFTKENGLGNSRNSNALRQFYQKFLE